MTTGTHTLIGTLLSLVISISNVAYADQTLDTMMGINDQMRNAMINNMINRRMMDPYLDQHDQTEDHQSGTGALATSRQWRVRIIDKLGDGQINETTTITIGGVAQTIKINKATPNAYVEFTCPNGMWPYSMRTTTGLYNQQGKLVFASGQGSGTVNCNGDGDLYVAGDYSVHPVTMMLQSYATGRSTAQAARAQTSDLQMGTVPQAPAGASRYSLPAGYYQCYRLTAAISANTCKLGDLQLDGQGNYASTRGPGGTYAFEPAAAVVSFSGGMLNGRMALAKISNKGTYMLRMRPDGNSLPSPRQTFGTYTFEHKRSGHRERW